MAVVASACASIKYVIDFRAARAHFYDAILSNRPSEVQTLLHRNPSLIRTTSPTIHLPGDLSVYTRGESPVSVAVLYESRDTFDYLLTLHPDLNTRGDAGITPLIWATTAGDIHYFRSSSATWGRLFHTGLAGKDRTGPREAVWEARLP